MTRPLIRIVRITDTAGEPIKIRGITQRRVQRSIERLLAENELCSIASITAKGRAHINTVYFCYSGELELYFLSHPKALHCQNILSNPSMAIAIFPSNQTWGKPDRGLQLFGICKQAPEQAARKADKLYGKCFAEYLAWKADLPSDSPMQNHRLLQPKHKVMLKWKSLHNSQR
jgi:uncharacterized protein YhbP (UPF0306 family)